MSKFVLVPPSFQINNGKITGNTSYSECRLTPNQPTSLNITNASVFVDGKILPVHIPPQPIPPPVDNSSTFFIHDPMMDYKMWYFGSSYGTYKSISDSEIEFKTWSTSEISDWINFNSDSHVLCQKTGNLWNFVFENSNQENKFSSWWMIKTKSYEIKVPLPSDSNGFDLEHQVKEWCRSNIMGKWSLTRNYSVMSLYVKDSNEAVMAKLRWSAGHDTNL